MSHSVTAVVYFFLFPQRFSTDLVSSYSSLITDMRMEGVVLILRSIELVLKIFPTEGPEIFRPMLPGFLQAILSKDVSAIVWAFIPF